MDLCQQNMSMLFNTLSTFVIAFLPRDKCVLIFFAAVSIHCDFRAPESIDKIVYCFCSKSLKLPEKDPDAGKDWRQEEKGTTEEEMVGWHHWLDGHEFEQAPGVGVTGKLGMLLRVAKSQTRLSNRTELWNHIWFYIFSTSHFAWAMFQALTATHDWSCRPGQHSPRLARGLGEPLELVLLAAPSSTLRADVLSWLCFDQGQLLSISAAHGDLETVRYLLTERLVELPTEPTDDNPAVVAAQFGHTDVVQELLESLPGKEALLPWWLRREGGRLEFSPWGGKIPWRRKWLPTPVLLPGKSHGQRSLVGYRPWGCKESNMTEPLHSFCQVSPRV